MFAVILLVALVATAVAKKEDLLVLNNENFYEELEKHGKVFVKFYAPWCGHCKRLAPAWEELAGTVEGVTVAEMDCTVEAHEPICSTYRVTGFPTIVFIENDVGWMKYEDSREVEDMRAWALEMAGPASKKLEDAKTTPKSKEISFILLGAEKQEDIDAWNKAMNSHKGQYGIFHTQSMEYEDIKVEKPSILVLKFREEPKVVDFDAEKIADIVRANNRLLVNELGPKNFSTLASDADHTMWITFVRNTHDEEFDAEFNKLKAAAQKCGEGVNFSYINAVNFEPFTKNFAEMAEVPFSIILKPNDYLFYRLPQDADICEFVQDVAAGTVEAVDIRERNKAKEEAAEKEKKEEGGEQ